MTITTDYEVHDEVYVIYDNLPHKKIINHISIRTTIDESKITYHLCDPNSVRPGSSAGYEPERIHKTLNDAKKVLINRLIDIK
jgi:hypothetical protein